MLTADDTKSANRQCGFLEGTTLAADAANSYLAKSPNSPAIQPYKQLFLRSNLGGRSAESLGVNGGTDIVRRMVVGNTPINSLIHEIHQRPFDCVTINENPKLNQIWFQLIDINGKTVLMDSQFLFYYFPRY